jgi:3-oxoacyl-[acyl-carrier protein] reductase
MASRGITVNAVAPGIIASPMSEAAFPRERIRQIAPAGCAGEQEEVAAMVAYRASDAAAHVTGQVLPIDGGLA